MKPLVDALGEIIPRYDTKDPCCPFCLVRPEEVDHADNCAWATVEAWHRDTNAILDGIRQKAGLIPEAKPDTLPAEISERA